MPQSDLPLEQPLVSRDVNPTNLALPDGQEATAARQILDMKYIYLKVRDLQIKDKALLERMIHESFHLEVVLPLPDVKTESMSQ